MDLKPDSFELLSSFKEMVCRESIKLHYLQSHADQFAQNLSSVSEEQEERFHQDIKTMGERCQRRWDSHIIADYCWSLKRDVQRLPTKESF